jgi:hypothetical protein
MTAKGSALSRATTEQTFSSTTHPSRPKALRACRKATRLVSIQKRDRKVSSRLTSRNFNGADQAHPLGGCLFICHPSTWRKLSVNHPDRLYRGSLSEISEGRQHSSRLQEGCCTLKHPLQYRAHTYRKKGTYEF